MPKARKTIVSVEDTPFYHCVSRCVRRAFLCGEDLYSGNNYEHRREWVENRLLELADVFAVEICAYAVMSNHLHVVLRIDIELVKSWSDFDVLTQWHKLFKGTPLSHKFIKGEKLSKWDMKQLDEQVAEYRHRLADISWFMRSLNEPIARLANKEDKCSGRFWEGRFKSQALLDEGALLACMAYVDLNPIRAKMTDSPEQSDFTSIQRRIKSALKGEQPLELLPFSGNERLNMPNGLPFVAEDYLLLVEETGRCIRTDKKGSILRSAHILERLNLPTENWLRLCTEFGVLFKGAAGNMQSLTLYCERMDKLRRGGAANCQRWFSSMIS
ncbi:transposase [Shewanella sp. 202IG2-18]|uniref:transposase n=1 Tax=Parashewanella hymeniacidonis TaxID=2807618 RepID=UPI0019601E06|nr:transposase [Parashewanella hymeniacidonis]MBM7074321.1 transposase [Parashewanella hymeniacidonis]